MKRIVTVLLSSLAIIPICAFYFAEPITDIQVQALKGTACIYLVASFLCFAVSELTKNYSQVDKIWSILPIIYVWYVAALGDFEPRLLLMALTVTAWGIRLTFNFARKGGYSWKFWEGEQDYRWEVMKQKNPWLQGRWQWRLFNLFFISFYQNGVTLLITYPMVLVLGGTSTLGMFDVIVGALMTGFLLYETVADNQQWKFQREKREFIQQTGRSGSDFQGGFPQRGLWKLSRHPNYMAEQGVWISFYLFSVAATGTWFNWSVSGVILLMLLFRGSSDFIEAILLEKYSDYRRYMEQTPRFFPSIRRLLQ